MRLFFGTKYIVGLSNIYSSILFLGYTVLINTILFGKSYNITATQSTLIF